MTVSRYFPVHHGLLTKEHRENMDSAIWEFLWLISKVTKEIQEDGESIGIVLGGQPIKNAEIAEELGYSLRKTVDNISTLRKHGYIITKRTPYGNIFKVRKSKKFYKNRYAQSSASDKRDTQDVAHLEGEIRKNMDRDTQKSVERYAESRASNKKKNEKEKKDNIYVEIIDYLNQKAGKRFSPKSAANQKIINGRISEGRTLEDFKQVIDVKTEEWLDNPEMNQYLRPSTLFRPTNFENYLNQVSVKNVKKQSDPRDKEVALQKWMTENPDANPDDFFYEGD